jgi:hypothetical protein
LANFLIKIEQVRSDRNKDEEEQELKANQEMET